MEMKGYQKAVIADLTHYLELLNETQNYMTAFEQFWREKSAPALGLYRNVIAGVPNLCIKVPTGGGKTFIACNAIRPVFDALPVTKTKAVVWLVPSENRRSFWRARGGLHQAGASERAKLQSHGGHRAAFY